MLVLNIAINFFLPSFKQFHFSFFLSFVCIIQRIILSIRDYYCSIIAQQARQAENKRIKCESNCSGSNVFKISHQANVLKA